MVVLLAIRAPVVLKEGYGCQFSLALCAGKVLGVPSFPHGIDNLAKDGSVARSTHTLQKAKEKAR